jgi:hypothetical protein
MDTLWKLYCNHSCLLPKYTSNSRRHYLKQLVPHFLQSQSWMNSSNYFRSGQKGNSSPGGPAEGLWLGQTQSFIFVKGCAVIGIPLLHPKITFWLYRRTAWLTFWVSLEKPVLLPGIATLHPVKGFFGLVFFCLFLNIIISRAGWAGNK